MNNDAHSLLDQLRSELNALREMVSSIQSHIDQLQETIDTPAPPVDETVDLSDVTFDALPDPPSSTLQPDLSPVEEEIVPEVEILVEPAPKPVSAEPQPSPEKPSASAKAAIRESTDRYAWRKDLPGAPVRDIRSAIALNDRVLFINTLFQQDAVRFQNTLTALNAFESLAEAEDYLQTSFPQWNLESEVVYRFMMAVRRKLR